MESIFQSFMHKNCWSGKCLSSNQTNIEVLLSDLSGKSSVNFSVKVLKDIKGYAKTEDHVPCVLNILIELVKRNEQDFLDDENKEALLSICQLLPRLPSKVIPLMPKNECDNDTYCLHYKLNPVVTKMCLQIYSQILLLNSMHFTDDITFDNLPAPSNTQKHIIKKTSASILLLTSSRLGNFSWTNNDIKKLCSHVNTVLCSFTNHPSISSLLAGEDVGSERSIMFPSGLLEQVLDELSVNFKVGSFSKNIPWKHAFIWCVTKVKYPHLGKHIARIVPFLLLMLDSFGLDNKLFSMSTISYLIDNVNPADLRLYNHSQVIYDALFSQLYSNKDVIYEIALPCLFKTLNVLDCKPDLLHAGEFTVWDTCIEKIIQNTEMSSNLKTRRVLIKCLVPYVKAVGLNIVKHMDSIFKAMVFSLAFNDGKDEASRFFALDVILHTIKNGWQIIAKYQLTLMKSFVKLIIDVQTSDTCSNETRKQLIDKTSEAIILLRICRKESVNDLLKDTIKDEQNTEVGLFVSNVLKNALEIDIDTYKFSYM